MQNPQKCQAERYENAINFRQQDISNHIMLVIMLLSFWSFIEVQGIIKLSVNQYYHAHDK